MLYKTQKQIVFPLHMQTMNASFTLPHTQTFSSLALFLLVLTIVAFSILWIYAEEHSLFLFLVVNMFASLLNKMFFLFCVFSVSCCYPPLLLILSEGLKSLKGSLWQSLTNELVLSFTTLLWNVVVLCVCVRARVCVHVKERLILQQMKRGQRHLKVSLRL